MNHLLAPQFDALATWRRTLQRRVRGVADFAAEHALADEAGSASLEALQRRLSADRLVLACVAEVSRGKSELLNAMFFADAGRRVLPAAPGRTTMCPVEMGCRPGQPAELALLPIETRLGRTPLADWRARPEAWQRLSLDPCHPQGLAEALNLVTQTRRVSTAVAASLGFWSDSRPQDNPPRLADGSVEVPAWRHALINYPHPLLQRGLVVIDTPGLNAVGAEPELTLGLLATAHAVVFLLGADTGVSRSDLDIWTGHLSEPSLERFVALNKTDTLDDPLSTPAAVAAVLDVQRRNIAQTLDMPLARVYPLSARDALAARIAGDGAALERSGLPALEGALAQELLPRQRELLARATGTALQSLRHAATRRLTEGRRHQAEQLLELRGLRGKSQTKVKALLARLDAEVADFEGCHARLAALRSVQLRHLQKATAALSSDALRGALAALHSELAGSALQLGARKAFAALCERLHAALGTARSEAGEIEQMLLAGCRQLNAEFGFAFAPAAAPDLQPLVDELALIERSYGRCLSPLQAWRLSGASFMEQFQRMLLSKLRVVFENAAGEIELWSRAAAAQIEQQLRERRRAFAHRREALQRIQAASGELEQRIAEVEQREKRLAGAQWRLDSLIEQALLAAQAVPGTADVVDEAGGADDVDDVDDDASPLRSSVS